MVSGGTSFGLHHHHRSQIRQIRLCRCTNIIGFALRKSTVAPRHPDEQDADPQRTGMAPINLRRKRTPVITSAACAAQYFVESIGRIMLAMIPPHPRTGREPQPKF
jgi:hypothetical protein